jgi:hypothetical protein
VGEKAARDGLFDGFDGLRAFECECELDEV